jgi:predicted phosphodiesterase
MSNDIINKVKSLISHGYGRRKIAKILGITEWHARSLMEQVVKNIPFKVEAEVLPTKLLTRQVNEIEKLPNDQQQTTTIKVLDTFEELDIPKNIISTRKTTLKVAVLSDIHYPYEDRNCIKLTKQFLKDYNPDIIILNGDIADCYSISKYTKDPKRNISAQDEIDYTHDRLREWTEEFPNTAFKYLEGNHESRLSRLIKTDAPALSSMRAMAFENALGLESLGIEWIDSSKDLYIGKLLFYHGDVVRKGSGATVKGHFDQYGCSMIIGHIHRLGTVYKRNKYGTHILIENGTLCDFNVDYMRYPDWQHGFTTLDFDGDDFFVRQYPIINYKLVTDNKVYYI